MIESSLQRLLPLIVNVSYWRKPLPMLPRPMRGDYCGYPVSDVSDPPRSSRTDTVRGLTGQPAPSTPKAEAFTFGDAEPVTSMRDIFYEGLLLTPDEWYEPPIPLEILAKSYRATAHHGSALQVKRNILLRTFKLHPLLGRQAFSGLALDYLVFGNGYLEEVRGRLGKLLPFRHLRAKYMRRGGPNADRCWWVPNYIDRTELPRGRVVHLLEPDIDPSSRPRAAFSGSSRNMYHLG